MKASLVSATSLGALLAFELMPAHGATVFTISANILGFGDALVNCATCTPDSLVETAKNSTTGAEPLQFGTATGVFSGGGTVTLAAGTTSTISKTYTFTPTVTGAAASQTVTITGGAATKQAPPYVVTLTGTGVAPVATTTGNNIGYVLAGATKSVLVTVNNTGNGNLSGQGTVSNLRGTVLGTTTGANSALFTGSNTSLTNVTNTTGLLDGTSQTVSYVFKPTSIGTFTANVTGSFTNGIGNTNVGGTQTATVTGTGVAPVSSVSLVNPTYVLVNSAANTKTAVVTVQDTGNGALSGLGSVSNLQGTQGASGSSVFSGGGGAINLQDTNATTGNGFAVAGSTTATFTYNFAPTASGGTSTTVTSTFNNSQGASGNYATGTTTVTLSGTGVAPINQFGLTNTAGAGGSVGTGNLGYLLIGRQTGTAAITLSNVGNGNLAGTGGAFNLNGSISNVTGTGYAGGVVIPTTSSVSLSDLNNTTSGATTQTYNYTFAPTAIGAATTTFTASYSNGSSGAGAGNNQSQTVTASLNGTGVAPISSVTVTNPTYVLVNSAPNSKSAVVTVLNTGNGALSGQGSISNLQGTQGASGSPAFSGGGGAINLQDSNATTGNGFAVNGSTTATFTYNFAPTASGGASTTVTSTFTDSKGSSGLYATGTTTVTLTATGVAPVNQFALTNTAGAGGSVGTGNLGYLLVGQQTGTATITLSDVGNGNLAGTGGAFNLNGSISNVTGTGYKGGVVIPTTSSVSLSDANNTTSGATTQSYNYTFAPTVVGAATTTFTASYSNGSSGAGAGYNQSQTVTASLNGTAVAPIQTVTGSSALSRVNNYGYVTNAGTGTATITVKNTGNGNLSGLGTISNLSGTVGGASGAFTGSSTALGGGSGLADSGTQSVSYTFAPTVRGAASTVVTVGFNNGNSAGTNLSQTVLATVTGQGVGPVYQSKVGATIDTPIINGTTATASTVNFGTVDRHTTEIVDLNISNITADLNGGNALLTDLTLVSVPSPSGGTDPSAFTILSYGSLIQEGTSTVVPIELYANKAGLLTSYLSITTDENAPYDTNGDTFTYELSALSVPEPASLAALGVGLVGLGFVRRRKPR